MADSDERGGIDDRVRLVLAGEEARVIERYEVRMGILTQPAAFSLQLGTGTVVRSLIERFPPGTTFELLVGDVVQFTGRTDGYEGSDGGGASTLNLRGRDALAPLHDAYVTAEKSYTDVTFADLVSDALAQTVGDFNLVFTNEANRKAIAGVPVVQTAAPDGVDPAVLTSKTQAKTIQAKVGERRYAFVKKELDRGGLFLWAAADGSFILSAPNRRQRPVARIVRRRGQTRNQVNVISARHKNDTAGRFSECVIHCRGGGGKAGVTKSVGSFVDQEMIDLGIERPLVIRDSKAESGQQAELFARRKIAEARRAGWQLQYTLAGHTVLALSGGGRVVWAPDILVEVIDDEYGIEGEFWVESVEHRRDPKTTTVLNFMRPEDLIFGASE